jgi:hypothetical protein
MMLIPHRKHTYGPAWSTIGTVSLLYMCMMLVPHKKHTYEPPWPVTGIALLFLYADDFRTSQETHIWVSRDYYGDSFTFYM